MWTKLRAFHKAIVGEWVALMSGIFGLVFQFIALWWPENTGKAIFLTMAFVAWFVAAFVTWSEERDKVSTLEEAQRPKLALVRRSGGSFDYETKGRTELGRDYVERLFRVGVENSGREACVASVVIQATDFEDQLLKEHRLRVMGRYGPEGQFVGQTEVAPAQVPTAYIDVIAEQTFLDALGHVTGEKRLVITLELGSQAIASPPTSFSLILRVDGGPQSTTRQLHCSTLGDSLEVVEVPGQEVFRAGVAI